MAFCPLRVRGNINVFLFFFFVITRCNRVFIWILDRLLYARMVQRDNKFAFVALDSIPVHDDILRRRCERTNGGKRYLLIFFFPNATRRNGKYSANKFLRVAAVRLRPYTPKTVFHKPEFYPPVAVCRF